MASLTKHLTQREHHARLRFRADCPWCVAERQHGQLPPDRLVSPRLPAAVTAGLVALSSTAPALAVAAEPDQQREGAALPAERGADGDGAQRADFDPGGPPTTLADQPVGSPDPPGPGNEGLDAESIAQDDATEASLEEPVDDPGDEPQSSSPAARTDVVPTQTPTSLSAPASLPGDGPVTTDSALATNDAAPKSPEPQVDPTRSRVVGDVPRLARDIRPRNLTQRARNLVQVTRVATHAARAQAVQRVTSAVDRAAPRQRSTASHRRAHWYVIQQGDSLWSLAARLLGYASATSRANEVTQIHAEVRRLWILNRDRLRSGKPDLVFPGERVRLR